MYLLHCFNFGLLKHFNPVDLLIRRDLSSGENAQKGGDGMVEGTFLINQQRIDARDAFAWLC